eukprot:Nitzschia sp. Nitz4//scaffold109_size72162//62915//64033//NITZ4_005857-RA/size72162-processed-gene-0.23-mRNA-1//1//CDS//3329532796//2349//frame0
MDLHHDSIVIDTTIEYRNTEDLEPDFVKDSYTPDDEEDVTIDELRKSTRVPMSAANVRGWGNAGPGAFFVSPGGRGKASQASPPLETFNWLDGSDRSACPDGHASSKSSRQRGSCHSTASMASMPSLLSIHSSVNSSGSFPYFNDNNSLMGDSIVDEASVVSSALGRFHGMQVSLDDEAMVSEQYAGVPLDELAPELTLDCPDAKRRQRWKPILGDAARTGKATREATDSLQAVHRRRSLPGRINSDKSGDCAPPMVSRRESLDPLSMESLYAGDIHSPLFRKPLKDGTIPIFSITCADTAPMAARRRVSANELSVLSPLTSELEDMMLSRAQATGTSSRKDASPAAVRRRSSVTDKIPMPTLQEDSDSDTN